ncbi:capsule biosynthesis protein [Neotabrizicola sp. VNH66]|uniref:capsule biosynthesis protein n=1 Tax=Neotabrizicola sp. VNH66 TaxID=3400918 RepID=UPI003C081A10
MTTLKATRFHIRRPDPAAAPKPAPRPVAPPPAEEMPFASTDDGFGDMNFRRDEAPSRASAPAPSATPAADASVEAQLEAIRKEGLTGRQLRTARRLAQSRNMPATSDYDAVRLLREAGVDPFQRGSMLELVMAEPGGEPAPLSGSATGRALTPLPGDGVKLPQTVKPIQLPSTEQRAEVNHAAEILKMQADIARRRRRKLALLASRLFVFILLPTIIAGWYFSAVATPMYATKSEFMIQQQEPAAAAGMGGLLQGTSLVTSQDSIAVQGYLQSRDAMLRLEQDHGFRSHFQGEEIDPILRLPADASLEEAYRLYARYVLISYDQSEGIVKMEVSAPTPELSAEWSRQLIKYAEEQVDQLTQRLREDSMKGARESYEEAEKAVLSAQQRVVELQERYKILSSEVEVTLLTSQIGALETQLTQEKLSLAQMESNSSPNTARMDPVKRRIATLEAEIAELRRKLTEGSGDTESLARIQGELLVAQADVQTRQMILAQAVQAMENSRVEANRQVRYLAPSVNPVPPDEPTYPRVFENTLVTLLILLGVYLMISMTVAILREQVSA